VDNADPANLINLSKKILSFIPGSQEHHIGFELIVEPKPLGYGQSSDDAEAAWEDAANQAAHAIANLVDQRTGAHDERPAVTQFPRRPAFYIVAHKRVEECPQLSV
jgi:hypothetical protein